MSRLIAVTSDLFMQSRFLELARSRNVEVEVLSSPGPKLSLCLAGPTLVVLDLSSSDYDPFETARELKKGSSGAILLGFYPHVRADLKRRAEEAGFEHVVINRDLIPRLSKLLEGLAGSKR